MKVLVQILMLALSHAVIAKAQDYADGGYGYGVENYDHKPTQSVSLHQNECALTDCAKLPYLQQCTPDWFVALKACTEPPCNVHYARSPAIECSGDVSTSDTRLVPTITGSVPSPWETAVTSEVHAYGGYGGYGDFDTTITEEVTVTATGVSTPTDFPDIPKCAEPCFNQTASTDGCEFDDAVCHCAETAAFEKSLGTCVVKVCSPSDQMRYAKALADQCTALGVSIIPAPLAIPTATLVPRYAPANRGYPDIPECSRGCFNWTAATNGCEFGDAACQCTKTAAYEASFGICIFDVCSPSDQMRYIQVLSDQCTALGVSVTGMTPAIAPATIVPGPAHVKKAVAYDGSSHITSVSGAVASAIISCIEGGASACPLLSNSVSFTTPTGTPSSPSDVYNVTTASEVTATVTATTSVETHSASSNASSTFVQSTSPLVSNSAGIGANAFGELVMVPLAVMTILGWLVFAA